MPSAPEPMPAGDNLKQVARMITNRHGVRRSLARGYVFDLAARVTEELLVDCGRERFYVSTSDRGVGRQLFVAKEFDGASFERTFAMLAQRGYDPAARVFLDVGANIGTTSVMAITRLGCSHVYAFEPAERNARMLRQNILVNDLEGRITPVVAAVSDVTGEAQLGLCDDNSGDHRVWSHGMTATRTRDHVSVPAVTIDDWLRRQDIDLATVGVLWIDAQGHEPKVLAGASRLLASDVPVICEFWPRGLREARALKPMIEFLAGSDRDIINLGWPGETLPPQVVGSEQLDSLAQSYPGPYDFCDLLLLPRG